MKKKTIGNILIILAIAMIGLGTGLLPFSVVGASQNPVVCNAGYYSRVIGVSENEAKIQTACFHKVSQVYSFNNGLTHMIPAAQTDYPNVEVKFSKSYTESQYNSYKNTLYVSLPETTSLLSDTYTFAGQSWKIARNVGTNFDAETLMNNVNSYNSYAKDIDNTCSFGSTVTCGSNTYSAGQDVIFFVSEKTVQITEGMYNRAFLFYQTWFPTYPYYNSQYPNEFLSSYWGYWDYPAYEYVPGQDPSPDEINVNMGMSIPLLVGGFALGGFGIFLRRRRR